MEHLQRRAGTARHDAVAWGYARGADEMGVDIIQNCEVKGIKRNGDQVEGIETTKGFIKQKNWCCCCWTFKCYCKHGWFKITFRK